MTEGRTARLGEGSAGSRAGRGAGRCGGVLGGLPRAQKAEAGGGGLRSLRPEKQPVVQDCAEAGTAAFFSERGGERTEREPEVGADPGAQPVWASRAV